MSQHTCHWPGCRVVVEPKLWGCKVHWFRLPRELRTKIWHTYRPGQEITKRPSPEYIAVAREVQEWIAAEIARADEARKSSAASNTRRAKT